MLLSDLVDLVLPRSCAGCGNDAALLCPACVEVLQRPVLGRTTPDPCPPGLPRTVAVSVYAGPVRNALLAHKEHGRLALARPLGEALGRAVELLRAGDAALVPVPSSRSAVRARGHDHAWRLARSTATATGRQAARLLVPGRALRDSAGLSTADRADNLAGAFVVRVPLAGRPVVIVDDVVTTGATLVEAARALRSAGAQVLGAAVLSATQRRHAA